MDKNEVDLLTFEEVVRMLGVKPSWLRSQIFKKLIPHFKISGLIRFSREDLENWLSKRKKQSQI